MLGWYSADRSTTTLLGPEHRQRYFETLRSSDGDGYKQIPLRRAELERRGQMGRYWILDCLSPPPDRHSLTRRINVRARAKALRPLMDAIRSQTEAALAEFDEVFGERA